MNSIQFHSESATLGFVLVYFIYGMSFFSLGVALLLESRRTPSINLGRRLLPLAVFGILHGAHEWLEFFIIQSETGGEGVYPALEWLRLILLVASFTSLLAYGVRVLQPAFKFKISDPLVGSLILLLYSALVLLLDRAPISSQAWFLNADALARISIAIPAALLAHLALRKRVQNLRHENRIQLAKFLSIASVAFLFYTFTQVFIPSATILYSQWLNADWFEVTFGLPIQAIRTVVAIILAISLIRATQLVEEERQQQLVQAQNERLAALDQLQTELSKREVLQREFLKSIVLAQEDERKRISRELHDETAQLLTAMGLELATIQNQLPEEPIVAANIERIQGLRRQMSRNMKRLVHQLRPAQLDDLGLVPAFRFLVDDAKQNLGISVDLVIEGKPEKIDPFIETVLFRVAQESITNVARHAKTDQAKMIYSINKNEIQLTISDQGIGFNPEEISATADYSGIIGMRERVEAADGIFQIDSVHNEGTTVEVKIPYPQT